jgi:hypothetical protein
VIHVIWKTAHIIPAAADRPTLGVVDAGASGEVDDVVDIFVRGQAPQQLGRNERLPCPTGTH